MPCSALVDRARGLMRVGFLAIISLMAAASDSAAQERGLVIAALGTSLTANAGWTQPLAQQLSACLGRPVRVVELAKAGETSRWGLTQIPALTTLAPDLILIEFSANDARVWGGVSMDDSHRNLEAMIEAGRQRNPDVEVILMAMNPMFGLRGWFRPGLDGHYDDYRAFAETVGAGFVDHRPAWLGLDQPRLDRAIPDGVHPENAVAAEIIVPTLAKRIAGKDC
jgi:acyl-CoA thioesterase I